MAAEADGWNTDGQRDVGVGGAGAARDAATGVMLDETLSLFNQCILLIPVHVARAGPLAEKFAFDRHLVHLPIGIEHGLEERVHGRRNGIQNASRRTGR